MKTIIFTAYSFIAALIGAGFASGQEILVYFVSHGIYGVYGVVACSAIFAAFVFLVLYVCRIRRVESFDEFLDILPNKRIKQAVRWSVAVFSFAVYSAMLASVGELLRDLYGLPPKITVLICAVISYFIINRGVSFVVNVNGVGGIILSVAVTACVAYILRYREFHVVSQSVGAAIDTAIYSGYNLIPIIPILSSYALKLNGNKDIMSTAISIGGVIVFMSLLMFAALNVYFGKVPLGEFPMLTLARRQNEIIEMIYTFILSGAVITTLLSSGMGMIEAVVLKNKKTYLPVMISLAYFLAGMGFSRIVDTVYRYCGIAGFIIFTVIVKFCIQAVLQHKKSDI